MGYNICDKIINVFSYESGTGAIIRLGNSKSM